MRPREETATVPVHAHALACSHRAPEIRPNRCDGQYETHTGAFRAQASTVHRCAALVCLLPLSTFVPLHLAMYPVRNSKLVSSIEHRTRSLDERERCAACSPRPELACDRPSTCAPPSLHLRNACVKPKLMLYDFYVYVMHAGPVLRCARYAAAASTLRAKPGARQTNDSSTRQATTLQTSIACMPWRCLPRRGLAPVHTPSSRMPRFAPARLKAARPPTLRLDSTLLCRGNEKSNARAGRARMRNGRAVVHA